MSEFTYIGKPATRVDALEKVLGTAKYIADYRMPGILHARCLRSDLPHARIVRLDVTPALRVPGVVAAITSEDFVDNGRFGYPVPDMFMLAHERVRYVGDAIAAVAAETEEALAAGLAAIELELEPLPAIFDPVEALLPEAPLIGERPWDSPELPRGNLLTSYVVRQGDGEELLAKCDVTLDEEYSTAHQEHAYLETEGALAAPTPIPSPVPPTSRGIGMGAQGRGVIVYSSNQSPYLNRDNLCRVLGMAPAQVRVIQPQVGGAFGGKDDLLYQTSGQVAKLALITGRPVRMVFSREESMIASYKRDAMQMHIRLGADRDGRLRSAAIHAVVDSGAYASITPFTAWRSSIHAMGPYRYEACTVDTDVAYTNNGYSGAFRGFGNTEVCAGIEQAIDQLAHRLNIDPIDFRLRNCLRPGDETPHGQRLGDDVALAECLEQVRRDSDWDRKRREYSLQPPATGNGLLRRGIGVAAVFHGISLGAEGEDFAVCRIAVNDDCSLTLSAGLTDYGTGSRTVYTLIAAETLGLEPGRINMPRPDTDAPVNSGPTVASRATVLGGNAARVAAERLNEALVGAAADLLGCDPAQVLREGERYIGPSEEPASFEEVVQHARRTGVELVVQGRWNAPDNHWSFETGRGKPYFAYHFGAQAAEVLVDTGTGKVQVTGIWAAHNAGKVIFPQGALGQLIGGITQGLGYALMERVDFDGGYMQATNFDEYLIPTAMDVPDMTGRFVEVPFSAGPFGAKNIGEPGMVPAAPAILNAIFHATGRRIYHLPATLERVLLGHDLRPTGSSRACKLGLKAG
jgi:CO/xanthine dehydrogenase Mo-binding subunit